MKIQELTDKQTWENFSNEVSPNTFLHSWNWGEVNKKRGEEIHRLGIYENEKLVAIALTILVKARRGHFLFCPHGPIIKPGSDKKEIIKTLTEYLKKYGREKNCTFFRVSPLLEDTKENNDLFYNEGYKDAGVHMMHPERAWMLALDKPEKELFKEMRKNTRYYIRKAEKEIVLIELVKDETGIEQFWKIYEQTAKRQSFTPFSKTTSKPSLRHL